MTKVGWAFSLLQAIQSRPTVRLFRERLRTQWLPKETLQQRQFMRVEDLLRDAANHVPYYRRLLAEHGVRTDEIVDPADFSRRVPTLNRATLVEHMAEFHSENVHTPLIVHRTGGSTGQPLQFPRCPDSIASGWADYLLTRSWWNVSMGEPVAKVWGHWHDPGGYWKRGVFEVKERIKRRATGTVFLSAYEMTPDSMRRFANRIRARRPRAVYGYVSALEVFGHYLKDQDLDLDLPGEGCVITTSEPLFDATRRFLRRIYGRPVVNEYGSCEAGLMAFECPAGSLHQMHDSHYIEVVDDSGRPLSPGVPGELVVTALHSHAVPLIRYRMGDRAILADRVCRCGREGPVLEAIEGRIWEMLRGPSGEVVYPQIVTVLVMSYIPSARRFQAVQVDLHHVTLRVVCSEEPLPGAIGAIERELRARLGESMEVSVRRVPEIEVDKSGKVAVVKSSLSLGAAPSLS